MINNVIFFLNIKQKPFETQKNNVKSHIFSVLLFFLQNIFLSLRKRIYVTYYFEFIYGVQLRLAVNNYCRGVVERAPYSYGLQAMAVTMETTVQQMDMYLVHTLLALVL